MEEKLLGVEIKTEQNTDNRKTEKVKIKVGEGSTLRKHLFSFVKHYTETIEGGKPKIKQYELHYR